LEKNIKNMRKEIRTISVFSLVIMAILVPLIIPDEYFIHLLINAGLFYMLVAGLNLLVGYLGKLTLGHTAFLGIGAYTAALLNLKLGATFPITLTASILISFVISLLFGLIVLRLRGPYFVIVSLCFAEMLAIVAINWISLTNGPMGLPGVEPPKFYFPGLFEIYLDTKISFYYLIFILIVFITYIISRLVHSTVGRAIISLRENENLAESIGVSAFRYGLIIFVIASVFAGVAGCFYAHYVSYVNPEIFSFSYMCTMLVMLVTGGKGTIIGPFLGCIIFTVLPEALRVAKAYRDPIFGIILIIVAIFFSQGMAGLFGKLWARLKERKFP